VIGVYEKVKSPELQPERLHFHTEVNWSFVLNQGIWRYADWSFLWYTSDPQGTGRTVP